MSNLLHVTNGDSLNDRLLALKVKGDYAVWREMLCEGKTVANLASEEFRAARISFFESNYPEHAGSYDDIFGSQLAIIADAHLYEEVVLWFEYDLFCHINMLACISFLRAINYKGIVSLVCSGRVTGEKELKGLSQLSDQQLLAHYKDKTTLTNHDIFLADDLWRLYCGNDHLKLKPQRAKDASFIYLSNCISAHKERFPHAQSGLNTLETNMLRLIRKYEIKTEKQLCGYMLNYQGYYGYGDIQLFKMITRMRPFFILENDVLTLTEESNNILDTGKNVFQKIAYSCNLGGVSKYDYTYDENNHQLTKL